MPGDLKDGQLYGGGPQVKSYDNGPFGAGQNDFQREAGGFDRRTPGFGYQGLGEDFFADLAKKYGDQSSNFYGQQLNRSAPGQTYDQSHALSLLRLAAEGGAPSQAELAMKGGLQQSIQNQASAAAAARGGPGAIAAAQRLSANNMAGSEQDMIQKLGMQRAAEMAQARDAYAGASGQSRGQDIQGYGIDQEALARMGGLDLQNRGMNIQALLGLYGLGQGAAGRQFAGQQAYNAWMTGQASHDQDANRDLAMRALAASMSAAGALGGAASDVGVKQPYNPTADAQDAAKRDAARRGAAFASGMQSVSEALLSDARAKEPSLANIAMVRDARVAPYMPMTSDARAKQEAFVAGMNAGEGMGKKGDADPMALLAQSAPGPGAQYRAAHPQHNPEAYNVFPGGRVQHAVGEQTSPNAISPIDARAAADQLLGKLAQSQSMYQYKDPGFQSQGTIGLPPHLGVMAQDLEKTPMGASLVQQASTGVKMVNTPAAQGAALAALGRLHERVSDLETKKKEKEKR